MGDEIRKLLIESISNETVIDLDTYQGGNNYEITLGLVTPESEVYQ